MTLILAQNDLLVDITNRLADQWKSEEPDWEELAARFKKTDTFKRKKYDLSKAHSLVSEISLRFTLEKICSAIGANVDFNPITSGTETADYRFDYFNDELNVRTVNRKPYSGIDALLLVDSLPVVFEVRLTKHFEEKAIRKESILRDIRPVQQFFGKPDCGYVFVVYPKILENKERWQSFIEMGGIVVPFYADREKYLPQIRNRGFSLEIPIQHVSDNCSAYYVGDYYMLPDNITGKIEPILIKRRRGRIK